MLHVDFYTQYHLCTNNLEPDLRDCAYVCDRMADDDWSESFLRDKFKELSESPKDQRIAIFSEIGIFAIRAMIVHGALDHTKVKVHQIKSFEVVDVSFDADGRSEDWGNWISPIDDFLMEILVGRKS